jgi:hypothetical protein
MPATGAMSRNCADIRIKVEIDMWAKVRAANIKTE